jgi:hypothetical protein
VTQDQRPQSKAMIASYDLEVIEDALRALDATGLPDGTLVQDASEVATRGRNEKASTFATKMYAIARYQGIAIQRESQIKPSRFVWLPLGRELLDSATNARAREEAFLNVPLHAAIIARSTTGEKFDDAKVTAAMRDEFEISDGQLDTGRQVLKRAARQAGFLDKDDRWVIPVDFPASDGHVRQEAQGVINHSTVANPTVSAVLGESLRTLHAGQRQEVLRGQDIDPIFTVVAQEMPKLDDPFVEDEWDEWFGIFTEAFKRAKRRARQRSVLQSQDDNRTQEA